MHAHFTHTQYLPKLNLLIYTRVDARPVPTCTCIQRRYSDIEACDISNPDTLRCTTRWASQRHAWVSTHRAHATPPRAHTTQTPPSDSAIECMPLLPAACTPLIAHPPPCATLQVSSPPTSSTCSRSRGMPCDLLTSTFTQHTI